MSIYKRGGTYWYKFMWSGELIRESAKTRNDKTARKIEAGHRTRLAEGLVDIREKLRLFPFPRARIDSPRTFALIIHAATVT